MPSFDITRSSTPPDGFRVASVRGMFDLNATAITERFQGALAYEGKPWNVGVIVGSSGSGKSTIAREVFGTKAFLTPDFRAATILDDMPSGASVQQIAQTFTAVGFASVPSWLKPYSVLSMGERMRVELAHAMLSSADPIVFDEFTSVVNREVAKTGSHAIQKAVRKANRKFVAVCCHRDVLDWLSPDWVYDTDAREIFIARVESNAHNSNCALTRSASLSARACAPCLASTIT
jgi:ABC-type ATPase with predicted acetyltransferase domain